MLPLSIIFQTFLPSEGISQGLSQGELMEIAGDFSRSGSLEAAAGIYGALPGEVAHHRLRAITGDDGFGWDRAQFLAGQFVDRVVDPAALGAMIGAQGTYRLFTPLLGKVPAFMAEASLFPLYQRLGDLALGRPVAWSRESLARDVQGSFLVLGGLKAFAHLGNGSLLWWQEGRLLRGSLLDQFMSRSIPTAAMYLGVLSGHYGEQALGLVHRQSDGQIASESLATLIHFLGAGRLLSMKPVSLGPRSRHGLSRFEEKFSLDGISVRRPPVLRLEGVAGRAGGPKSSVFGDARPARTPSRGIFGEGRTGDPGNINFMESNDNGSSEGPKRGQGWIPISVNLSERLRRLRDKSLEGDQDAPWELVDAFLAREEGALGALEDICSRNIQAILALKRVFEPEIKSKVSGLILEQVTEVLRSVDVRQIAERAKHEDSHILALEALAEVEHPEALNALKPLAERNVFAFNIFADLHDRGIRRAWSLMRKFDVKHLAEMAETDFQALDALKALEEAGHLSAGDRLAKLNPKYYFLRVQSDPLAVQALFLLWRSGHPNAEYGFKVLSDLNFLVQGASQNPDKIVALSNLAEFGHGGAMPLLSRMAREGSELALTAIYELGRRHHSGAVPVLEEIAPFNSEALDKLETLAVNGTPGALESLTRLGETQERAASLLQELVFTVNPVGALEALAKLFNKSAKVQDQIFQAALRGKGEAYDVLALAALEGVPARKLLVKLTREITTRQLFPEAQEDKVLRIHDDKFYRMLEAVATNVDFAYSALGKAAGQNQGVLRLLEDLTYEAFSKGGSIEPAIQALAFAAGENLRAVYSLYRFFQGQRKVSVGRANWIREQMADIPVHNLKAWDSSNYLAIYPLRLLVEAGNPYAVTRLGNAALENLRALSALEQASLRPEPWVGNAFRDIYVPDFALDQAKHGPDRIIRQARVLAIMAKKNNYAAFETLKAGLIQFGEPAYFAFDWLCRFRDPNLQRMLREADVQDLIHATDKSPSAEKAVERLASLGNPKAKAFLEQGAVAHTPSSLAPSSRVISRQFPGTSHQYKLVLEEWSNIYPGFEAESWSGMGEEMVIAHREGRPLRVQLREFAIPKGAGGKLPKDARKFGVDLIEGERRGQAVFFTWDGNLNVSRLDTKDLGRGAGTIFLDWISTQALMEGYRIHFTNIDNPHLFRILDRGKFLDAPRSWVDGFRPDGSSEGKLHLVFQAPFLNHESVRQQHPEATIFNVRGKPNPKLIPDNFPTQ